MTEKVLMIQFKDVIKVLGLLPQMRVNWKLHPRRLDRDSWIIYNLNGTHFLDLSYLTNG